MSEKELLDLPFVPEPCKKCGRWDDLKITVNLFHCGHEDCKHKVVALEEFRRLRREGKQNGK